MITMWGGAGSIVSEAEERFGKSSTFYSISCKFETALKINSLNLKTRLICPKGASMSYNNAIESGFRPKQAIC